MYSAFERQVSCRRTHPSCNPSRSQSLSISSPKWLPNSFTFLHLHCHHHYEDRCSYLLTVPTHVPFPPSNHCHTPRSAEHVTLLRQTRLLSTFWVALHLRAFDHKDPPLPGVRSSMPVSFPYVTLPCPSGPLKHCSLGKGTPTLACRAPGSPCDPFSQPPEFCL